MRVIENGRCHGLQYPDAAECLKEETRRGRRRKTYYIANSVIFILLIIFISCKNNDKPKGRKSTTSQVSTDNLNSVSSYVNFNSIFRKCFNLHDTLIDNITIHYLIADTNYTLQIAINGIKKNVYEFNCKVPGGLVPQYYSSYHDQVCFKRGYGSDFREFIVYYLKESQIIEKKYETALIANMRDSIVILKDDNTDDIIIENIITHKKKKIILPKQYRYERIQNVSLYNDNLQIEFDKGKKIAFTISNY